VEIKILGALEARENGVSLVPSAAKPRQILALLALCVGQVVPTTTLLDELWGGGLPRSSSTTLQTYIMQLRKLLQQALPPGAPRSAKDILRTHYNGYVLDVEPHEVDVQEYEQLSAVGTQAFDLHDDERASRLLGAALARWRGPILVDVRTGPQLEIEVLRLEESRLGTLERRIEADLRLGRHHALLSELAVLSAQYPWHEGLHAQHMFALYRSGRQWLALDAFKRLRAALVNELGLEPSPRLQKLQRAILASDPDLDAPWSDFGWPRRDGMAV
jgi:SARP family transcriptional regulator, regulator of embCAB operon